MQATARRLSVVSATSCARRRLIRSVGLRERGDSRSKHLDFMAALLGDALLSQWHLVHFFDRRLAHFPAFGDTHSGRFRKLLPLFGGKRLGSRHFFAALKRLLGIRELTPQPAQQSRWSQRGIFGGSRHRLHLGSLWIIRRVAHRQRWAYILPSTDSARDPLPHSLIRKTEGRLAAPRLE